MTAVTLTIAGFIGQVDTSLMCHVERKDRKAGDHV